MNRVGKTDLLRVALRLAFLQSTWCEGSMQSEGLGYCLVPGLSSIHSDRDDLNRALKRCRAPFNTHPFLVGVVAGALLKMEEDQASYKKVTTFLRGTMGPLAAVGDPFFKGALAPTAAVFASLLAVLFGPLVGAIALLVSFNLFHLIIRMAGVFAGYREGEQALARVACWMSPARTRLLKAAAAAMGGVFVGVISMAPEAMAQPSTMLVAGGAALCAALLLVGRRSLWVYVAPGLLAILFTLEIFL